MAILLIRYTDTVNISGGVAMQYDKFSIDGQIRRIGTQIKRLESDYTNHVISFDKYSAATQRLEGIRGRIQGVEGVTPEIRNEINKVINDVYDLS